MLSKMVKQKVVKHLVHCLQMGLFLLIIKYLRKHLLVKLSFALFETLLIVGFAVPQVLQNNKRQLVYLNLSLLQTIENKTLGPLCISKCYFLEQLLCKNYPIHLLHHLLLLKYNHMLVLNLLVLRLDLN